MAEFTSEEVMETTSATGNIDIDADELSSNANSTAEVALAIAKEIYKVDDAVDEVVKLAMTGTEIDMILKDYLTRRESLSALLKTFAIEINKADQVAIAMKNNDNGN